MSILSRLFKGGPKPETRKAPAEDHKGFRIIAAPREAEGGYRVCARIEKEIGGETKVHHLMRADVLGDRDAAEAVSIRNEAGDRRTGRRALRVIGGPSLSPARRPGASPGRPRARGSRPSSGRP